jgi:hypothetical protein
VASRAIRVDPTGSIQGPVGVDMQESAYHAIDLLDPVEMSPRDLLC